MTRALDILRASLVAGLVGATTAPALGVGAPPCARTQTQTPAGIFDWVGPPSTVCRDRASDAARTTSPPATPRPAATGQTTPASTLTFSGEAYVGMAWTF